MSLELAQAVVRPGRTETFFGWRVVLAAFVVAVFGWGIGFYGPPIFLHAIREARGWPVSLVSAAVTTHFLVGAIVVANLATLHRRFGIVAVTRAAAIATALGLLGWSLAAEPWQLFAATLLSGAGWAATSAAAINAMVSPWFVRRRPAALAMAYNGSSVGGVVLTPLWVALIAWLGFPQAALVVGLVLIATIWPLARRYLGRGPAAMGLRPDNDAETPENAPRRVSSGRPVEGALRRDRRFVTLAAATSLGLFAQVGLIAHLFTLLVPILGPSGAGAMAALATACAVTGRTLLGWVMPGGADRRLVAAANYGVQLLGSVVLAAAVGDPALVIIGVALFGIGLGNVTSLPPLMVQAEFTPADTARVVALVTAASQASYAFAPAVFGALRDLVPGPAGATPFFLAIAAVQLAAACVLIQGRRTP